MDFFTALFTQPVPRLGSSYKTTFSMTLRERRQESYRRYRGSMKGWERTRRYNATEKHLACARKYRDWRPRTEFSYQVQSGRCNTISWVHPLKIDPQTRMPA